MQSGAISFAQWFPCGQIPAERQQLSHPFIHPKPPAGYTVDEIIGILNMADLTALLSALGIVDMSLGTEAEREARAVTLLERMKKFAAS